ncbi:hypothetical protein RFI_22737 [Reticulomyxa filosa]|uniref:Uncharacterized protein n=1 Tax=Reticulomyxa filosa TaxID=46433 RepID=X6MLU4_RETFI|nr:hypothetical protein RFI_22737 [Reticulomyxa filosa]|eukprot:ETO14631.1 hypothetical protein RFI_22737 [Reticulomyxa filosa]
MSVFGAFVSLSPNGMEVAWTWLAHILQFPQILHPLVCHCVEGFLTNAGYQLLHTYPRQFPKLIRYLEEHVIKNLDKTRLLVKKLDIYIRDFHSEVSQLSPPRGCDLALSRNTNRDEMAELLRQAMHAESGH